MLAHRLYLGLQHACGKWSHILDIGNATFGQIPAGTQARANSGNEPGGSCQVWHRDPPPSLPSHCMPSVRKDRLLFLKTSWSIHHSSCLGAQPRPPAVCTREHEAASAFLQRHPSESPEGVAAPAATPAVGKSLRIIRVPGSVHMQRWLMTENILTLLLMIIYFRPFIDPKS